MRNTILLSILLFAFNQTAFSHAFHYEVQVKNELISKDEKLLSLKMTWLYDDDVSIAMLGDQENLKMLGDKLISDLDLLGYFTQIKLNGKTLPFDKATDVNLEKIKDDKALLKLSFALPLSMPIEIPDKSVISLDHEDPVSAAILFYENPSDVKLNAGLKQRCKTTIKEKETFLEGEFPQVVKINCSKKKT